MSFQRLLLWGDMPRLDSFDHDRTESSTGLRCANLMLADMNHHIRCVSLLMLGVCNEANQYRPALQGYPRAVVVTPWRNFYPLPGIVILTFVFLVLMMLLGCSCVLVAQPLDASRTLTIAGQTVQANADGSFRIPNVAAPDLFGPDGPGTRPDFLSDDFVRLTGFSTRNGVTRYVFSEPFQIRQGEPFQLTDADLTFTDTPPLLPQSLRVAPDAPTLTALGQTTEMRVSATFHGGGTRDVSQRKDWTIYRTSNPGVAAVNRDGVTIAGRAGMTFITAVNEGATVMAQPISFTADPVRKWQRSFGTHAETISLIT